MLLLLLLLLLYWVQLIAVDVHEAESIERERESCSCCATKHIPTFDKKSNTLCLLHQDSATCISMQLTLFKTSQPTLRYILILSSQTTLFLKLLSYPLIVWRTTSMVVYLSNPCYMPVQSPPPWCCRLIKSLLHACPISSPPDAVALSNPCYMPVQSPPPWCCRLIKSLLHACPISSPPDAVALSNPCYMPIQSPVALR